MLDPIFKIICDELRVCPAEAMQKSRKEPLRDARHIFMWICRYKIKPEIRLKKIGQYFNQDHATVINGIRRVDNLMETEYDFRNTVFKVLSKIVLKSELEQQIDEESTNYLNLI